MSSKLWSHYGLGAFGMVEAMLGIGAEFTVTDDRSLGPITTRRSYSPSPEARSSLFILGALKILHSTAFVTTAPLIFRFPKLKKAVSRGEYFDFVATVYIKKMFYLSSICSYIFYCLYIDLI